MKLTLVEKENGPLSKIIRYKGGGIEKDSSECWLSEGKAIQYDTNLKKLAQGLRKVKPNQALIHGINGHKQINILSERKYTAQADTITRTKEHFTFVKGEGSAFFDHDPKPGQKAYPKDTFLEIMADIFPAIETMANVWTPSTSSCIYKDDKELVGLNGGFHLYFAVKNATDLPRFSEVLFKRLWLAGHGYIFVTRDGKLLERTIFDTAVFSPERLDFVAGAVCKDGLVQRLPAPVYTPGNVLDTSLLKDLTEKEEQQHERLVAEAKGEMSGESEKVRKEYVKDEVKKLVKAGTSQTEAQRIVEQRIGGDLAGDDVLYFDRAGKVTIEQILNNVETFDKQTLRDPLEPDYGPHKAIFYANQKDGKPVIYSQAHGGRSFFLQETAAQAFSDSMPTPLPVRGNTGSEQGYQLDLLPEAVRTAAAEIARFAKVPEVSPAVVGLSCIATAIGKKAVIVERPGLEHHPALFQTLIAASGERKSPAFLNMTSPFDQWTADQKEIYEESRREAKANNMAIDSALGGLKSKAKKPGADLEAITKEMEALENLRITEPPFPSLYTTDTTEQRLFQKMHDRGGAYAVMSGEGRQVLDAIMGKYSGDGRTGDAIYLAGISGDTITRDRVGGDQGPEERLIFKPCLNVCIMVQPDKYTEAARCPALRESGALARIWPVWLPSLVGSRIEQEGEPGLNVFCMSPYIELIETLLQAKPPEDEKENAYHKAHLSEDASKARREYHNAIEKMMAEGEEFEDVRDIASKAVSQTAKLALVLHLADNPELLKEQESIIEPYTWARAQALGTYHLQEAIRVQRMADEDTTLEAARRVLKWIEKEGLKEVNSTMLMQESPRPRPKAKDADNILELLSEYGYLIVREAKGRRKPVYDTTPYLASLATLARGEGKNAK